MHLLLLPLFHDRLRSDQLLVAVGALPCSHVPKGQFFHPPGKRQVLRGFPKPEARLSPLQVVVFGGEVCPRLARRHATVGE